jgi:hypothetical protein
MLKMVYESFLTSAYAAVQQAPLPPHDKCSYEWQVCIYVSKRVKASRCQYHKYDTSQQ